MKGLKIGQVLLHNTKAMRKDGSIFNEWSKVQIIGITHSEIKVKGIENLTDKVTGAILFGLNTTATTLLSSFDYFYKTM